MTPAHLAAWLWTWCRRSRPPAISSKDHNLHVVHYSEPVDQELTLEELKDHLFTVPDLPDHLPYVTSYYHRRWGFCISQRQFDSLKPGIYRAVVKSEIKPGRLVYGQAMIPGRTDREVLISTYLCHPQMANHELSGPLVQAYLYKMLSPKYMKRNIKTSCHMSL